MQEKKEFNKRVLKDFKNIFDEIFHSLCCNSETATDLINFWLPYVLKPKFKIKDVRLYLPDKYYNDINENIKVGKVENDVTLVSSVIKDSGNIILQGDIVEDKVWKDKLFFSIEAQSKFSYNIPFRQVHYMALTLLSRVSYLTGQKHSEVLSKKKFNEIRSKLPIVVPVWINQDLHKTLTEKDGLIPVGQDGVYLCNFKNYLGREYEEIINNVFDFTFIYINLKELNTQYASTEEIGEWISAYKESLTQKELRGRLERRESMTVVMEMYREGIAVGEKRGEERGIALGEKRGIVLGEERGAIWGRNEAITAIISLMQQNGFSTEDICKNTGLSKEEVLKLMSAKQT